MAKNDPLNYHRDEDPILQLTPEGLGPWSISKLKMLQNCPLQFYLKYVKKIKEELIRPDEDRMLTFGGSALHDVLDQSLRGTKLSVAYARTRQKYQKDIPKEYWEKEILTQEYNIMKFLERIESFNHVNPVKNIYTEQRIGLTRDYEPTGFFSDDVYWRGVIDLAIQMENRDVILIDHKSGGSAKFGLKNYEFQLNTYKPAFHFGISKCKGAQSGIHFIKEGSVTLGNYSEEEEIVHHMEMFEFFTKAAIEKVIEDGGFFYSRGSVCKYCDFKEKCSGGKRGTSGELAVFEEESKRVVGRFLGQEE